MKSFCIFITTFVLLFNMEMSETSESVLEEENAFKNIHEDLQKTSIRLFKLLKLHESAIRMNEHRLLALMHYTFENKTQSYFNVFMKLKNSTRISNKTLYYKFKEAITEALRDYHLNSTSDLRNVQSGSETREYGDFLEDIVEGLSSNEGMPVLTESTIEKYYSTSFTKAVSTRKFADSYFRRKVRRNFRRLYRSEPVGMKEFPFIASVHILGKFVCSGSILSSWIVITAATCLELAFNNNFYHRYQKSLTVRVGSDYTDFNGTLVHVNKVFFHPGYNLTTLSDNLALLRLGQPLKIPNQDGILKIKINKNKKQLRVGSRLTVLGWGDRGVNMKHKKTSPLGFDLLQIDSMDDCTEIYTRHYINHKTFCARSIHRRGGACDKDLGGPGIYNNMLLGVVSFGPTTCGAIDSPTVFTRVAYYAQWIDSVMEDENKRLENLKRDKTRRPRIRYHHQTYSGFEEDDNGRQILRTINDVDYLLYKQLDYQELDRDSHETLPPPPGHKTPRFLPKDLDELRKLLYYKKQQETAPAWGYPYGYGIPYTKETSTPDVYFTTGPTKFSNPPLPPPDYDPQDYNIQTIDYSDTNKTTTPTNTETSEATVVTANNLTESTNVTEIANTTEETNFTTGTNFTKEHLRIHTTYWPLRSYGQITQSRLTYLINHVPLNLMTLITPTPFKSFIRRWTSTKINVRFRNTKRSRKKHRIQFYKQ